ncbi:hypothetical protein NL676_037535 [Syzygium grande]|nr:hypothetical protein NL676_037535 [Syzygium grande]
MLHFTLVSLENIFNLLPVVPVSSATSTVTTPSVFSLCSLKSFTLPLQLRTSYQSFLESWKVSWGLHPLLKFAPFRASSTSGHVKFPAFTDVIVEMSFGGSWMLLFSFEVQPGIIFSFERMLVDQQFRLAMIVVGEIIRKMAIITAGRAFTHLIKIYHEDHHKLITHGIYRFIRHPGYCGFFIWSVGTQIMLCNPVSTFAFAAVVWHFFATRIPYEEFFLRQFFGREYEEYAQTVPSGVPFVK